MSTYCESGIGLFSTQPINTISNIAIIISALFAYKLIESHHIKNITIRILPVLLAATGIGSMFWHGIPSLLTNFADVLPLSIFVLVSFFFLLDKILSKRSLVWIAIILFMFINAPFVLGILPSLNGFIPYLFILSLGFTMLFALAKKYKTLTPNLTLIVILFAIALFFRTIDLAVCSIISIGTHFIWHILNALMFYLFVYAFIRIEQTNKPRVI